MPPSTAPRSSAGGGGGTKASELCARVERLFTPAEDQKIPYTNHAHGCELLCRIRRQVANGERLHKRACRSLAFAGIDVWRSARADDALDAEGVQLLSRTCTLIFATLASTYLATQIDEGVAEEFEEGVALGDAEEEGEGEDGAADGGELPSSAPVAERRRQQRAEDEMFAAAGEVPLWALLRPARRRKAQKRARGAQTGAAYETEADDERDALGEEGEDEEEEAMRTQLADRGAAWHRALRVQPQELAELILKRGVRELRNDTFGRMDALSFAYFRARSVACVERLLMPDGDVDFCTLDCQGISQLTAAQRAEKLFGIVQMAESEAGQQVIRDLLLSLWLPSDLVGLRRTLLLARSVQTAAGVDYPELTQRAHHVAMAGAEWTWEHSKNPAERMAVLLAGLAMQTTVADVGSDVVRKASAFGGRVQLPFLETPPPTGADVGRIRVCLVPHAQRWIAYRVHPQTMEARVLLSQRGMEGLLSCVLHLLGS